MCGGGGVWEGVGGCGREKGRLRQGKRGGGGEIRESSKEKRKVNVLRPQSTMRVQAL